MKTAPVWRVRDVDITARALNEVLPPSLPLVVGERTLQVRHRTPATKAKMAQRIVLTAAEGITDPHALVSAAVEEERAPAA
jgi:hypothetical protein